jgi:hypothetical protein
MVCLSAYDAILKKPFKAQPSNPHLGKHERQLLPHIAF